MESIDQDIKDLVEDLDFQQQVVDVLQKEKYEALTRRGMAMIHLPDSNIKIILPASQVGELVRNAQFVISEDSKEQNAAGVLTPFAGQLNVTYFTGD